ncbi:MAG: heme lyase CcmF/NrfE family subunit [Planctomycetota bacterium]|jgi:cytochrome c-type biogenesis protein CcmF
MSNAFDYLDLARGLVLLGGAVALLGVLAVLIGSAVQDRRFVLSARRAVAATSFLTIASAILLTVGFVDGRYERSYIYNYSEKGLPLGYKIAGLWGGLDGSILFWAALIGVVALITTIGFRRGQSDPHGRRMEPWVYLVFGVVQLFFLTIIGFVNNPFELLLHSPSFAGDLQAFLARFPGGVVEDGSGLNPLLVNYWMMIHPPCLYFGWVVYTVPFAYAIAALITGEQGNYWITRIRRWTMIGWLFNTTGIILGGLWAYVVLGWGGYWAWDPVENASFLPWFTSTALLHSIMVQERRGMLRTWNAFLATTTFVLSIFGTYLTRSGVVSSVHAFGSGNAVGMWFLCFLLATIATCLFLIALRQPNMRAAHRIESVWSREAMFVINNLVLCAIAACILILTMWPKISKEWLGQDMSVLAPVYNKVTVPFFVLLLLITAIGPALGWIRTSRRAAARNLILPMVASLPVALVIQYGAELIHGGEPRPLDFSARLYPTFVLLYVSVLISFTVLYEVLRTASNRARRSGEGFAAALVTLLLRNNRRYGGYFVHVGLAVISIGIVCSSMYKVQKDFSMERGESVRIGTYELTLSDVIQETEPNYEEGRVYARMALQLDVRTDAGRTFQVFPERRVYPKKDNQAVTEVEIRKGLLEDLYVFFQSSDEAGHINLSLFRNPLINLVWAGWIFMIAGGVYAALPLGRKRVGLAD